jgi:hypothetical protein
MYALTLSECGADCLDLHLGNIVFTIPNINFYTVDELYATVGHPIILPISTHSGEKT